MKSRGVPLASIANQLGIGIWMGGGGRGRGESNQCQHDGLSEEDSITHNGWYAQFDCYTLIQWKNIAFGYRYVEVKILIYNVVMNKKENMFYHPV
jgi:hypothetical protein